uniref:Uncharacterized protein n=1 Tax=Brassica oleracea TaxID=3712 RepID=A0A3P6EE96_BRAOL|nr:unnamed protein product [Brassica oleracea]
MHGVDEICSIDYSFWSLEFALARVSTRLPATPSVSPIFHDSYDFLRTRFLLAHCSNRFKDYSDLEFEDQLAKPTHWTCCF